MLFFGCESMKSRIAMFVLVACSVPGVSNAQWEASEVVTSYVSGTSPTLILGFDNNLEICLALQEPTNKSDLRDSGISYTDSQLVLLQLWHLVEQANSGELRCTVPVIAPPISGNIETLAGIVADKVMEAVGGDIETYLDTVNEAGWPEGRYALLGSFVLDGLVWKALEHVGAIENADPSTIPTGSEYWSGVTWITLPPQSVKLGTNSHYTDDGTLYTVWTPSVLGSQEVLQQHGLREELIAIGVGRVMASKEHSRRLDDLELINDGKLAVPVILAESDLCMMGGRLATRIGRALTAAEGMQEIAQLIDVSNETIAMIMAYHWVYPAILSRLEARGLRRPPVLTGESGANLSPTLYILQHDVECVAISD